MDTTLESPPKIYLQNSNLCYTIARGYENIGTLRETFIFSMLYKIHAVILPLNGDFLINKNILLEVVWAKKGKKQIQKKNNGYIVSDDIEIGIDNKIPLWAFGFLY